jgi:hypothetical protein
MYVAFIGRRFRIGSTIDRGSIDPVAAAGSRGEYKKYGLGLITVISTSSFGFRFCKKETEAQPVPTTTNRVRPGTFGFTKGAGGSGIDESVEGVP